MNWNQFTEKMTPYVNKAKEYWQKAVKFTENQIQTTPLFIKTQAEYDAVITEKRVVIIWYDEAHTLATEIQLLSTVWLTRAFMDNTKLRFIWLSESSDFARNIGIIGPLDMRVRFEWEETYHFNDITEIKKWWQATVYKKATWDNAIKDAPSVDPLAAK